MITKYDKDAVSAVLITTNVGDVHIKDEPKLFFFIVHQNFAHVLFVDSSIQRPGAKRPRVCYD